MDSLKMYFRSNMRQYGMVIALVFIMIFFQILTNGILFRPMNINNLILQNSYVLILAVGMLLPIITGNIDLSVGSVVAFVGAIAAVMMVDWNMPVGLAVLLSLLIGLGVGAFHGVFIAYFKIPPFIVTLAGMLIFRGLTMVILQGQTKAPFARSFQSIAAGYLPGMDIRIGDYSVVALLVGVVVSLMFVIAQILGRKNKKKYGFEVLPLGFEIAKAVVVVTAVNLLTISLAAYNGIPYILVLLTALVLYIHLHNPEDHCRQAYLRAGRQ